MSWMGQYLTLLYSHRNIRTKRKEPVAGVGIRCEKEIREDVKSIDMLEILVSEVNGGDVVASIPSLVGMINGDSLVDVVTRGTNEQIIEFWNHKVVGVSFPDYVVKSLACD